MKRLLIVILLILLIVLGVVTVKDGFSLSQLNLDVASYSTIKSKSENVTKSLAAYDKKNNEEYETAVTSLKAALKRYSSSKTEYEDILKELGQNTQSQTDEQVLYSSQVAYEIDFLLTTIGTFGYKEGVDVTMDVVKSAQYDADASTLGYTLCDLNFRVSGEYIDISYFLYDLEDDDELSFEIRDYQMTSENATFTVYAVPIKSATLIDSVTNSTNLSGSETDNSQNSTATTNANSNTSNNTNSNTNNTTNMSNTASNNTNTVNNTTNTTGTTNSVNNLSSSQVTTNSNNTTN